MSCYRERKFENLTWCGAVKELRTTNEPQQCDRKEFMNAGIDLSWLKENLVSNSV
jgi:hypothetical protein